VILTQADQFPLRVATVRQAIAADNTDRVDGLDGIDEGRRLTDEDRRHLRHVLELAAASPGR
jgi:hypothetical protein